MKPFARFAPVVAGLVMLMNISPSWGQPVCAAPGCNPTMSDSNENTAGGTDALFNVDETPSTGGNRNVAFGFHALTLNTTGSLNTALGHETLASNTMGTANTAVGVGTLFANTIGFANTAVGANVLVENISGSANTAIGSNALFVNTTGNENTATGQHALLRNRTGNTNTASGSNSMFANDAGSANTATGWQSLGSNVDGNNNTAIGTRALFNSSTGSKNIGIGYQAGLALTTGSNNIFIGNQGVGDEAQTIRIGTAQTRTFIAGINAASVSDAQVMVDTTTGQLGIVTSSARYKQDIAAMGNTSGGVLKLRPVTFAYRSDAQHVTHYGLLAEEVAVVYPELVTRTATGDVQTVKYQELIPMLLNELQRQQRELAELRALVGSRLGQ